MVFEERIDRRVKRVNGESGSEHQDAFGFRKKSGMRSSFPRLVFRGKELLLRSISNFVLQVRRTCLVLTHFVVANLTTVLFEVDESFILQPLSPRKSPSRRAPKTHRVLQQTCLSTFEKRRFLLLSDVEHPYSFPCQSGYLDRRYHHQRAACETWP